MIKLPKLLFGIGELDPYMSHDTVNYHYNHLHDKYVKTVNNIIKNNDSLCNLTLTELIDRADTNSLLDVASSQAYNHNMMWSCLSPKQSQGVPSDNLLASITSSFGGYKQFKSEVEDKITKFVGSGWLWVYADGDKTLVKTTSNHTSFTGPILFVIDMWEHAYYLDTPADKTQYVSNVWNILNWNVINDRYENRY